MTGEKKEIMRATNLFVICLGILGNLNKIIRECSDRDMEQCRAKDKVLWDISCK